MPDDREISGTFEELSWERCEEFLRSAVIGRIAYAGREHIEILPVNYTYQDDSVLLRTSPYGPLAALATGVDGVAFEVDHHEDLTQSGWSVLVAGRVAAVPATDELTALWEQAGPNPWAAGTRNLFLRITPTSITGRLVRRRA
ncbi:pyridoxamine 5'-phosphate oxidase family protein [Solicola gregarius]|uniref:Pyridoxamine 5'-phosphate oxidase family protein n=1 Tax=Solicola gregarius TaxID=2908642 RepID=A0AA46YIV0_9ACTN|nr:pyridoxamine 5'-phosphate oxidase family protein [Solicola gregarius]UYM03585.1 pyridoxamine 5'-phosphate oxidase family protein [Solicola gregarius]